MMEVGNEEEQRRRRRRVFRPRVNMNWELPEPFRQRFRISTEVADAILSRIGDSLQHNTGRNMALSPKQQLLLALRFYATGSTYIMVGDGHGPSLATVCRTVHKVSGLIMEAFRGVLRWPTDEQLENVKRTFHAMQGLPDVIGAVDGTHINVTVPVAQTNNYTNRKGSTSLNVMIVAGPERQIFAISAHASGRVHDARVLRTSGIVEFFDNGGPVPGGVILGDSAYPCLQWLLTPITAPQMPEEERYNSAHAKTRVVVENTIGNLRLRFAALDGKKMRLKKIESCVRVIITCAILHNLCQCAGDDGRWMAEDVGPEVAVAAQRRGVEVGDQQPPAGPEPDRAAQRRVGQQRRNAFVRLFRR